MKEKIYLLLTLNLVLINMFVTFNCTPKLSLGIVKECTYDDKNHIYHIKLFCPKKHKDFGIHSRTLRHVGDSLYFKVNK